MRLRAGVVLVALSAVLLSISGPTFAKEDPSTAATKSGNAEREPQFGHERKDPDEIKRDRDMAKARSKERFQQLQSDTDKLLQLATELKQYVDKTKENMLSVEVIRKAEEIEKLSKSVREKMKGE